MTSRDDILRNLRMALAKPDLHLPATAPTSSTVATPLPVTHAEGDRRALAERFCRELTALHGTAQIVESVPEARLALISQLLRWVEEENALRKGAQMATGQERLVLSWDPATLPVPALPEALSDLRLYLVTPDDLATDEARKRVRYIRYGVTGAEAAFAATGSLLMATGTATNRVASLLPFRHLALIPFSRLYATPEAWLYAHRQQGDLVDFYRSHANLTLISGPSKSADIEMNLTLGVHGPKFVHAILFDDQREGG